jgi:GT2 family glycosyltransferase
MTNKQPLPAVHLVIATWNRWDDLAECLQSLLASDYSALTIWVIDNGSIDDTVPLLGQHFPTVHLIQNATNLGFGPANNQGIRAALEAGADYVMLLNNDTTIDPDTISSLVYAAEEHHPAVVAPPIYRYDAPEQLWFGGMRFRWNIYFVKLGKQWGLDYSQPQEVHFVTGCAMMAPRQIWEKVGVFDEAFFMYYEDVDLCHRIREAGYSIWYIPHGRVLHKGSASTDGGQAPIKQLYQIRGAFQFLRKHTSGPVFALNFMLRMMYASWTLFKHLLHGRIPWRAIVAWLRGLREGMAKNRT